MQIHHHITSCPSCAAEVAWLMHAIALMRSDDSEDVPAAAIAHVKGLLHARTPPDQFPHKRRLLAHVRFDSACQPAPAGLRAAAAAERQLVFRADEWDIELRIALIGSLWVIAGQLLGPEEPGEVELRSPVVSVASALNDLCEFELPPVPPGTYTLHLQLGGVEIALPGVEVGPHHESG